MLKGRRRGTYQAGRRWPQQQGEGDLHHKLWQELSKSLCHRL